jgi:carboxymethylenebutenolidase
MKRAALLFALIASSLMAQDWAKAKIEKSPRHREWVTIKHDGRSLEAYVAYPEVKEKTPVILVIHEIFGHSDWVQDMTDELAEAGYIAISPDLLSGMGPNGGGSSSIPANAMGQTINKLPPDQITADLNAAADYARNLPAATHQLFVAGFCYGGSQAFRFATNRPDLKAAFVFYGQAPWIQGTGPDKEALARIKAPVYGFYAGNDARIGASVPDTVTAMKELGKQYEPVTYEGAGHGFMRGGEDPAGREGDKKARTEAWARWMSLLKSMR